MSGNTKKATVNHILQVNKAARKFKIENINILNDAGYIYIYIYIKVKLLVFKTKLYNPCQSSRQRFASWMYYLYSRRKWYFNTNSMEIPKDQKDHY